MSLLNQQSLDVKNYVTIYFNFYSFGIYWMGHVTYLMEYYITYILKPYQTPNIILNGQHKFNIFIINRHFGWC